MKIEFLENTGDVLYENVLRIFKFNESETITLKNLIKKKVQEEKSQLEVHSLDFVFAVNCTLTIIYDTKNASLTRMHSNIFEWRVNSKNCANACSMLDDSLKSTGFFWFNDEDSQTNIDLLFSEGGGW